MQICWVYLNKGSSHISLSSPFQSRVSSRDVKFSTVRFFAREPREPHIVLKQKKASRSTGKFTTIILPRALIFCCCLLRSLPAGIDLCSRKRKLRSKNTPKLNLNSSVFLPHQSLRARRTLFSAARARIGRMSDDICTLRNAVMKQKRDIQPSISDPFC